MPLTQAEADALLQMPKEFVDVMPLEFPNSQALSYVRELRSMDRREQFLFDPPPTLPTSRPLAGDTLEPVEKERNPNCSVIGIVGERTPPSACGLR
jgi:hypothetical protein